MLFSFDPRRQAILLLGGDKTGEWNRWYQWAVPLADDLYDEYLLYELRHGEAISQAELAGRLDVTQGAISKLKHSAYVRVSTLRQYLEALGARLELVAVSTKTTVVFPCTSARAQRPDIA